MAFEKNGIAAAGACETGCPHHKHTPRDEQAIRLLQNRLNRMIGQLNGIKNMVEDNRYCGDILTQVAAVESALQSFGYIILQDHWKPVLWKKFGMGIHRSLTKQWS